MGNARPNVNLSRLAEPKVQKYSEAIEKIPAEVAQFVRDGYERTKALKGGEWLTVELESAEDVKTVVRDAGKWARHHALSFRTNVKATKGATLAYRVIDRDRKEKPAEHTEQAAPTGKGKADK